MAARSGRVRPLCGCRRPAMISAVQMHSLFEDACEHPANSVLASSNTTPFGRGSRWHAAGRGLHQLYRCHVRRRPHQGGDAVRAQEMPCLWRMPRAAFSDAVESNRMGKYNYIPEVQGNRLTRAGEVGVVLGIKAVAAQATCRRSLRSCSDFVACELVPASLSTQLSTSGTEPRRRGYVWAVWISLFLSPGSS